MISTAEFFQASQWAGIATLVFGALTALAFIFKWGIRFRLVGVTGFMGVLTSGLFALALGLFTHTTIPGAVRYALVYDNGGGLASIAVSPKISETELEATLRQAAADLFSYGRSVGPNGEFIIRSRTIVHPEPGVSQTLYLGKATVGLANGQPQDLAVKIYQQNLAQLPKPTA